MFYVYLLRSRENGKIYTGYSANLRQRVRQHKSGDVHTTGRMGLIDLIFYEAFLSEVDAKRREKYLKSSKGKKTGRLMLKDYLGPIV